MKPEIIVYVHPGMKPVLKQMQYRFAVIYDTLSTTNDAPVIGRWKSWRTLGSRTQSLALRQTCIIEQHCNIFYVCCLVLTNVSDKTFIMFKYMKTLNSNAVVKSKILLSLSHSLSVPFVYLYVPFLFSLTHSPGFIHPV